MKIYLDYIFIENFLIDFILIKETGIISKQNIKTRNAIIASIFSSLYVVIMVYFGLISLNYLLSKLLLVVCIIYIAFNPTSIKTYLKLIGIFMLVSVINVGSVIVTKQLLNIHEVSFVTEIGIYVVGLGISKLFVQYMWKIYKQDIKENNLMYNVKIKIGSKKYSYKAFLDTGNNVFSYTENLPVLFAVLKDEKQKEQLKKLKSFSINTVTLSSSSSKTAYVFDNVEIRKNNKIYLVKAAIVFINSNLSKNNEYDMLLNYKLYVEKLGGIKI